MATVASASLTRYSMSWGVSSVVAGMGMTPALIMPRMATYHSGTRGPMKKARSPLPTPSPASMLANLLDSVLRSQKECLWALSPSGATDMSASLVRSSAHLSITSKPKLKCSGTSSRKFFRSAS